MLECKRNQNNKWRKLHCDEHFSFCRFYNIVRVIKFTRIRWEVRVARMKDVREPLNIPTGKPIEKTFEKA